MKIASFIRNVVPAGDTSGQECSDPAQPAMQQKYKRMETEVLDPLCRGAKEMKTRDKLSADNSRKTAEANLARGGRVSLEARPKRQPGRKDQKTFHRLARVQFVQKVPGDKLGRSYAQLLIASVVKRATKKSDILVKEIFDRIEGKVATPEPGKADTGVRVDTYGPYPSTRQKQFLCAT